MSQTDTWQECQREAESLSRMMGDCQVRFLGEGDGATHAPLPDKSKKEGLGHFRLTGAIHVYEKAIHLPRLGRLRLKEENYLPTEGVQILSATVSEQAGRWFVSLQVTEELPDLPRATGDPIGIDLGIKTLAMCSDGTVIANPKALRKNIKKLIRAHRRLSRHTKGGKNRAKARKRLARMYYHVGNIRKDALHKATSLLTAKPKREKTSPKQRIKKQLKPARRARPTTIVLEDLHVAGMKKNRKLARAISDVGMGEFKRQMLYKAEWMREAVLLADRFYPSTKKCSRCGHVKEPMDLSERVYICEQEGCGLILDRDLNAALNLVALA